MATSAIMAPCADGAKFMSMLQLAAAANVDPHPFVMPNAAAFAPVTAMPAMFSGALPVFVSVRCCNPLLPNTCGAKSTLGADSVTTGAFPVNVMVCDAYPGATAFTLLSTIVSMPAALPAAVG